MALGFAAAVALGLSRHEMWRDELQAWLIAATSESLADLADRARYEGHPLSWHVLLFLLSRATRSPEAMQVLQGLVSAASGAMIAFISPFSLRVRAVVLLGYFVVFEYALISRAYGLGLLATIAYCALAGPLRPRPFAAALVLAVLANTSAYGLIVSAALAAHFALACAGGRRVRAGSLAGAALIFLAGALVSAHTMTPPGAIVSSVGPVAFGWDRILKCLATAVQAYVPIPLLGSEHFWNSNLLIERVLSSGEISKGLVGLAILLGAGWSFRADRSSVWAFSTGSSALLALSYVVQRGAARHAGHLFVLFLACLWLSRGARGPETRARPLSAATGVLLLIQAAAGVIAFQEDFAKPFSRIGDVAEWIRREFPTAPPIAGAEDFAVSPLSAHLDVPIYLLESGTWARYVTWNKGRLPLLSSSDFSGRVAAFAFRLQRTGLLVMNSDRSGEVAGLHLRMREEFRGSVVPDENFVVYEVSP